MATGIVKVAALQTAFSDDVATNVARVTEMVREAAGQGAHPHTRHGHRRAALSGACHGYRRRIHQQIVAGLSGYLLCPGRNNYMSGYIGRCLHVQIFGESHGAALGATLDGLPAGIPIDVPALEAFLQRRAAKGGELATGRQEADLPRILSGLHNGVTTGYPITAIFENADTHSSDYGFLPIDRVPGTRIIPRW